MSEFSTNVGKRQFSGAASLAASGVCLQHQGLFGPVRQLVQIAQKTVKGKRQHLHRSALAHDQVRRSLPERVRWPTRHSALAGRIPELLQLPATTPSVELPGARRCGNP